MSTPAVSTTSSRYKRDGGDGEKDYAAIRARRTEISDYTSQRLAELRSLRRAESESYADYKTRREARESAKDLGLGIATKDKDTTNTSSDYISEHRRRGTTDSGSGGDSSSSSVTSPVHAPKILSPKDSGPGALRSESFRLASEYKSVEVGKDRLELRLKGSLNNGSKNNDDDEFVGFATLPDQVHRKAVKRGFDFTLMVVGESGLGKSTLISSLFLNQDLYKDRKVLPVEEAILNAQQGTIEERVTKSVQIQKKYMEIEEKGVKLRLTIVDTPGFNDTVNAHECWKPVEDYINGQFDQFFKDESGLNRKNIKDNRVHCCLYFVSPYGHGLRQVDIAFMKRLHGLVNIVPVIAKADTLTPIELKKLKHKVLDQIEEHNIKIYEFPDCDSDEDEEFKQQDKELKASIPFAVIGSNTVVEVSGKKVRGRLYPWGIVEVDNPAHCDFNKLRQMLISTHMQDLKDVTRDVHYENYRAKYIKEQMSKQQRERNNNLDAPTAAILSKLRETPYYNSKLKRDSSPNFESIMDQDKLLQQKDEEIRKMQAMLLKMQEQLQAKNQQVNGAVNGLGNL